MGEGVETGEATVGGNVAAPSQLLGTHPDNTLTQKDARTPALTAAVITAARTGKTPKPIPGGWTRKTRPTHTVGWERME